MLTAAFKSTGEWIMCSAHAIQAKLTTTKNSRSIQNAPGLKSIPETAGMNAPSSCCDETFVFRTV